jgi:hypothetical protein
MNMIQMKKKTLKTPIMKKKKELEEWDCEGTFNVENEKEQRKRKFHHLYIYIYIYIYMYQERKEKHYTHMIEKKKVYIITSGEDLTRL